MIEQSKKVLLAFCDARIDKENPLLMHMGVAVVVASLQTNCIKPEYVHSFYQTNRIAGSVSEAPFYELFSVAEGLAYLARIEEKAENIVVFNDCSGTVDLLVRLGKTGSEFSFKHKSLYLASLGENYHSGIKFHWLRRNHKGMALADLISRCPFSLEKETKQLELEEKIQRVCTDLLNCNFPIEYLN